MAKKNNKYDPKDSKKVAESDFDDAQFEEGMKETREQVSDDYKEGTIDRKKGKED